MFEDLKFQHKEGVVEEGGPSLRATLSTHALRRKQVRGMQYFPRGQGRGCSWQSEQQEQKPGGGNACTMLMEGHG